MFLYALREPMLVVPPQGLGILKETSQVLLHVDEVALRNWSGLQHRANFQKLTLKVIFWKLINFSKVGQGWKS